MKYHQALISSMVALIVAATACATDVDKEAPGCICAEGQTCIAGECKLVCDVDSDTCPAGLVCLENICVPEFRCTSDDACPGGRCVDGGCYLLECIDGETRECSSECGAGVETCSDEVWLTCDAPIPRVELCGNELDDDCDGEVDENCGGCSEGEERACETACGAGVALCVDSEWQPCPEEGECQPGDTRDGVCGTCEGVNTRVCSDECEWGEPGDCVVPDDAECAPGDRETQTCETDGAQVRRCQDSCTWSEWGHCFL